MFSPRFFIAPNASADALRGVARRRPSSRVDTANPRLALDAEDEAKDATRAVARVATVLPDRRVAVTFAVTFVASAALSVTADMFPESNREEGEGSSFVRSFARSERATWCGVTRTEGGRAGRRDRGGGGCGFTDHDSSSLSQSIVHKGSTKKKSESATEKRMDLPRLGAGERTSEPIASGETGFFASKKGRYPMVKRGRRTRS